MPNLLQCMSQAVTMKARIFFVFAVFVLGGFANRLVAQHKPEATAEILALEKDWTDAYKDRNIKILATLLAEDFLITVEDGSTYSKGGYIAHSNDTSVHVDLAELLDLRCRIHGNTAIVTGGYHEKGTSKGKPYEYRDRFTDVWININGKWQVLSSHYSVPFQG